MSISPQRLVSALLEERPETLAVFLRHRMHCPGCVMARFTTLAEAAANYGIAIDGLLEELDAASAADSAETAR